MSSYNRHVYKDNSRRDRESSHQSGPAPVSKPRSVNELPNEFGRLMEPKLKEDENTVSKRMRTAFTHSPLKVLYECIMEAKKIKIWTRNFEEIRGICAGYVVAFDKHWNMILADVDEVYVKSKKERSAFLDPSIADDLPELPPKVPKVKKKRSTEEEVAQKVAKEAASKKPKKKKLRKPYQRHLKYLFIRGNNIIMVAVLG